MSEANGKVCCNCRHCIRVEKERHNIECHCDIDNRYLGYLTVMTHWCRRWARDKKWEVNDGKKKM